MTQKTFDIIMMIFLLLGIIAVLIGVGIAVTTSIQMSYLKVNSDAWFDKFDQYLNSLLWIAGAQILFLIMKFIAYSYKK